MKKVITIMTLFFCAICLTNCTDENEQLNETEQYEREIEIQLVDPEDDGSEDEEDYRE